MKKFKYIFIASAFTAMSLVGCNDLDTEPLGSTITADQKEATVKENPERIKASVAAIHCSTISVRFSARATTATSLILPS